ncbi:hypothetical transcript [Echinococcus multilocularis]|uniref:Hypothetical transcript n=1 Tax=Echinococcus multilocularis TaxID=6211 RepID=A0A068YA65_ECHMU|nr:hypothetical transcript [Echinococcus multilocularis]
MQSSLLTCLRDSLLHQYAHQCFRTLQHPKLHLRDLLQPTHKEWYFVVLEHNLGMITRCLNEACGDVDETLARSLKVSVKLANAYARRELLLDHSLQQINTALQRADPIVTMSSLIQQNDNLNGIAIDLVGTSSVKLRARVDLIPEELKAALNEKGDHLTYEEMLRVLHCEREKREQDYADLVGGGCPLGERRGVQRGSVQAVNARREEATEMGQPSIPSHCEIQSVINETAEATHLQHRISAVSTVGDFEAASTSAGGEMAVFQRPSSISSVQTYKYYLSCLSRSLTPGNEFVLWGWLQALRATGCLSSVSAALSSHHIDLYRSILSSLRTITACSVTKALQSAHKIHTRALQLGKVLAEFNVFLLQGKDSWEDLANYMLQLAGKRLTPHYTILKLNVQHKHIEKYVDALIQLKNSKTTGALTANLQTTSGVEDCHSTANNGWLVASLASVKDEEEEKEEKEKEKDIHFYFNIKSQMLIWKPSHTIPEPTYLEPDLLSWEEIERCIDQVNLGVPLQQTKLRKRISVEGFDLLDRLIRAWIVREHYLQWTFTMTRAMQMIGENASLLQGICQYQALWRGFCMRRCYKAYLAVLRSTKLRIAATTILQFIRIHRRRRFIELTLAGLRRVLRYIRRFQALWRGFALRQVLTSSLALALNPMSQRACERPLLILVRLCGSHLVPTQADNIYNYQLDCFQAAQGIEDNTQQLVRLQDDITHSSKLLQLAEEMRQEALAPKLRLLMLCLTTTTLCSGSRVLSNNPRQLQNSFSEQVSRKYSGLLFLLYAQPDYLARLLIELPSHVLWVEKHEGVLEACRPSEFALRLERIILSLYNYGKRGGGGEVRLMFLITRALHMQLHASSWNNIKGMRGHFALRLAVVMTHVSHSMQGTVVKHLIPLLQDILTADAKREEVESRPASSVPQGDNSRSGGNTRKLEWTGAVHEEATLTTAVTVSSGGIARRWTDATSLVAVARALSPTSSKVANVSWFVQGAERLFHALFEEKGGVILPFPLHRLIQEVFCLMHQCFPLQPMKDLLKFIGLHIFYRYIHSIILAPDAFTSTITDSKKPTTRVERPQEMHRTTLAALSRLLRLVVENKGIAPHTEVVDQTHALNSLIKKWHVRFKAYLLNVIEDERLCWSPSKGKLQRLAQAWIRRLSCAKEVITEACNVTMNVEELVEVHRLINAYRVSIAPNPDDPLHEELDRVERLPQALYRHPDAKEKEGVISEDFGWKVEVTEQRPSTEARGLESFTLAGHITSKTRVAAPSLCTVPRKVAKRDRGLGGGVGGDVVEVSGSNINNTSTTLGTPQLADKQARTRPAINFADSRNRESLYRYYRFDDNETVDLVLPEGDQLRLSFQANSPNHLANAYLYTARALGLSSTSCFSFASRTCCSHHTYNAYSHAHTHTFLPTARNCVFCASERIHRRPAQLIFGWTEAQPPTGKSTRLPGRRALSSVVDGAGMSEKFAIGETHRRTRFTIGKDGVIVCATPASGEKIVWPVEARQIGASWTRAKRALMHLFSCLATHRSALKDELLLEKQKSTSDVPRWFGLLRSWLAPLQVQAGDRLCSCARACPSVGGCASVKRLQESVSTLQSAIANIRTVTSEDTTALWHDLIVGVVRDVFHMDAACMDAEWRNIGDRLAAVNCTLEDRIHKGRLTLNSIKQALSHTLRPCSPLHSKFAIRSREVIGVSLPFDYLVSHTILVEAMCAFSGRQMRNMRLDVVAVSDATLVGGFCLTASLLHVRWEEPEAIEMPHLLWLLHCGQSTLPLFSGQLHFNLAPFVKMLFKKFYATPVPTQPSPPSPPSSTSSPTSNA